MGVCPADFERAPMERAAYAARLPVGGPFCIEKIWDIALLVSELAMF
jgi:hypothetical protein